MKLQDFSLLKEDSNSYVIGHPKGKSLTVPKKGLSDRAQKLISQLKRHQDFDEGSEPVGEEPIASTAPAPDDLSDVIPQQQPQASEAAPEQQANPAEVQATSLGAEQAMAEPPPAAPEAPASPPPIAGVSDLTKPIETAEKAVQGGEQKLEQLGKQASAAYQQGALDLQKNAKSLEDINNNFHQSDAAFLKAVPKIDVNRYFKNQGTISKIVSGIGLALSGIGSGLTGQPNLALQQINKAIDRDLEDQKQDQSKAVNLWKMNRDHYQNDIAANLAAKNQMLNIAQFKAQAAQSQAPSAQAQANIAQTILGLEQQKAANNRMLSMFQVQRQGGSPIKEDPAHFVSSLVPAAHQQKVFDEIGAAQDTARMAGQIMKSFDDATKENTVLRTGAGLLRTPGSVLALHQAMQPTFKDLEGTVRQAAMENTFHNITPAPGDTEATIKTKRNALAGYLQSKASAPVAKGYGIDLRRFQSTNPNASIYPPGSVVEVKGKQYKIGADGNQLQPL